MGLVVGSVMESVGCVVMMVMVKKVAVVVWFTLPHKWGQKSEELLQDPLSTVYPSKRRG